LVVRRGRQCGNGVSSDIVTISAVSLRVAVCYGQVRGVYAWRSGGLLDSHLASKRAVPTAKSIPAGATDVRPRGAMLARTGIARWRCCPCWGLRHFSEAQFLLTRLGVPYCFHHGIVPSPARHYSRSRTAAGNRPDQPEPGATPISSTTIRQKNAENRPSRLGHPTRPWSRRETP